MGYQRPPPHPTWKIAFRSKLQYRLNESDKMERHTHRRVVGVSALLAAVAVLVAISAYGLNRTSLGNPLFSFSTTVTVNDLSVPGGPIFKASSKDGRFVCAANYVYAVSSRLLTNSNQIEFFCRDTTKIPKLNFQRIRGIESRSNSKSNILYYRGSLIDIVKNILIDRNGKKVRASDVGYMGSGRLRYLSRMKNGTYLLFLYEFRENDVECPGLSIIDGKGNYYGSVEISSFISEFSGLAIFDYRDDLFATEPLVRHSECAMLGAKKVQAGVGRPYGGIRTNAGFLLGGSGFPAQLYEVHPDLSIRSIRINEPPKFVSELYSYISFDEQTFVGTYPFGDAFAIGKGSDNQAVPAALFSPSPGRWRNPTTGAPYRELQSMVYSYGIIWGGMYPWGEIIANDRLSHKIDRFRLFSHPERTATEVPYVGEATRQIEDFWRGRYDSIPEFAEARRDHGKDDELPRILGLFTTAWGQRVSQIVVKNGALCASTGSMGTTRFAPTVHTHLTSAQFEEYGLIWCAPLESQALADVARTGSYAIAFSVSEHGVSISIDGKKVISPSSVDPELISSFMAEDPAIESIGAVTFKRLKIERASSD